VDLPGYGFAKVSLRNRRRWEQMIENYLRKRENLMSVFVLIDSRHKPQRLDLQFVNQLGKWEIPFCLVFTKADQESQRKVSQHVQAFLEEMKKHWAVLPPHIVTSALKHLGKKKLLEYIDTCNRTASSLKK
jgi:GTP-binding protein